VQTHRISIRDSVIAGLDPAIHRNQGSGLLWKKMDAWVKPGMTIVRELGEVRQT
jgi:hypothetical protein